MTKVSKSVKSSELLSILAIGQDYELVPEPYSGQPSLSLIVSFDAFLKFCRDVGMYGKQILSYDSESLQNLCDAYDRNDAHGIRTLQGIFMQEIAYSVMKELSYSELRGKGVTNIRHTFNGKTHRLNDDQLLHIYQTPRCQGVMQQKLLGYMRSLNYDYPSTISDRNLKAYIYANVLYSVSDSMLFE